MRRSRKHGGEAAEPAAELVPIDLTIKPRPRDRDRRTRRKLSGWDRCKYTLLLGGLFAFYWWQKIDDNPIKSVNDAFWETVRNQSWVLVLLALEWIRQIHFLIAEHSARYYHFWKVTVFGRFEGRSERLDPWTRYRLARVLRWVFALVVVSVVVGQITNESPLDAMVSLPSRINDALPFALRLLIYPLILISQFVMLFWFLGRGGVETYYPDDIDTRFDDVWGQDPVKEKVRENLIFLENPEAVEDRGGYTPGGILLYGPPGTGKTLLAEAAAGETGKPFVFVDPGAFINMFMGVGIIKVRSLFRKLRKLALRYGGVVVFFDEADSLGNRGVATQGGFGTSPVRTFLDDATEVGSAIDAAPRPQTRSSVMMMGGGGGGMGTLQALLSELSGLKKPRGFFNRTVRKALGMRPKPPPRYRILVMMASNMPEALDDAMLRPGRIDRIYKVGYPTKDGRIRTYEGYLNKVRHCLTAEDIDKLATMTPYATGAKIKDTVNEALINAIRDGREVITWADIIKAKQLKEHGLADDFHYVEHERHAIAVHEACHAVAVGTLCGHRMIDVATIERRGDVGGFVSYVPPEDRFTHWRSEYDTDVQVSLASLAGERMLFDGDNSSGVGADMRAATRLATLMVGYWSMGSTFTSHAVRREFGIGGGGGGGGRPGEEGDREEELLKTGLGDQVEQRLADLFDEVSAMLASHRLQVLAVAHALETHLTITGDDVMAIIHGHEGPFIDGAGYYRPEAIEKLEAYHSAVLEYRRRGIEGLPPLPEIEGVTGRIVSSVVARAIEPVPEPEPVDASSNADETPGA
ncbi:MAG TPA: AAA family ATPase [Ilumatobacter sp.]|nr:AAA family ATPase [Ilumatobacter sp.]